MITDSEMCLSDRNCLHGDAVPTVYFVVVVTVVVAVTNDNGCCCC